ncbi:HAD family hydrolase [Cryptosporangium phraense]|uniref:HAD family hydrolase n=1 Tax=Cryptosporangium phraense TaxID=2593070 RepID=A0A545APN6_9ACTN|nr:HAD family hydrolase [Cryptosporangium phraense]TQS43266.1 HAD family hydrolase [Cryptosporangium phraense]
MADIAVFDVDGTLVDTNYQHALAWFRAFRRYDLTLPVWRLHRAIGMGGDQLVEAVAGGDVEKEHGDDLRAAWEEEYAPLLPEVQPFEGARRVLEDASEAGQRVVLASSGKAEHVEHYLDLLDARPLAAAWTTSDDVERTKPEPDLVAVAIEKVGGGTAVMVGDSVWDCEAARRLGVACYAVRTGGFSVDELRDAGARDVFDDLNDLRDGLRRSR